MNTPQHKTESGRGASHGVYPRLKSLPGHVRSVYYGWWIVAACSGIILLAGGPFYYGFGVFADPLRDEFGWSNLAIAAAFSLRSEVSAIGAPVVGILIDRIGPRKVTAAGIVCVAVGLLMFSQLQDLAGFYVAIVVIALGTNLSSSQTGTVVVARWFRQNRSRALTFFAVGGGLSGASVPPIAWMTAHYGWRTSSICLAALTLIGCLPLALLIRDNPPAQPRQMGPSRTPGDRFDEGTATLNFWDAVRSRAFWPIALAFGCGSFGSAPLFALLIPALTRSQVAPQDAALIAGAIPLLSLAGRFAIGIQGDFRDKRMLLALSLGLQCGGLALLAFTPSTLTLTAFVLVFAAGYGGPIPLRGAILADHFGTAGLGKLQGVLLLVTTGGGLLGPVVAGWLVDLSGSYQLAFFSVALVVALGAPMPLLAPRLPSRSA